MLIVKFSMCTGISISHLFQLMRKLLGTHLGHSSIYNMCCMMQDVKLVILCVLSCKFLIYIVYVIRCWNGGKYGKFEISNCRNVQDQELLRGVVYFVGMALWGYRKVPTLRHTFSSVLPSFLQVRLKYTITYHTCSHVPGILNKHCNLIFFFHFIVDIRINTNKNLIVYLNWLSNYPFIDTIRQAF